MRLERLEPLVHIAELVVPPDETFKYLLLVGGLCVSTHMAEKIVAQYSHLQLQGWVVLLVDLDKLLGRWHEVGRPYLA